MRSFLLITWFVLGLNICKAADKPSPFPDKRAKETAKAAPVGADFTAMEGNATYFRLKDAVKACALTAAHATLPIGSQIKVVNEVNQKSVVVRVTDRFTGSAGQVISVSLPAAEQLGFVRDGTARVRLEPVQESAAR